MPLTSKGTKILSGMEKEYGAKKGKEVFYASRNKGTISGVDGAMCSMESLRSAFDSVRKDSKLDAVVDHLRGKGYADKK